MSRYHSIYLYMYIYIYMYMYIYIFDSWSLGHLGYLYPGTTPVMIKLGINSPGD